MFQRVLIKIDTRVENSVEINNSKTTIQKQQFKNNNSKSTIQKQQFAQDGGAVEPGEHQGLHTQPALLRGLVGSFDDPAEEATLGGGEEHRGSLLQPRFQAEAAGSHRRGTKTQVCSVFSHSS